MENRRKEDPRLETMEAMLKDLHDAYFGNGNDGMKTTLGKHGVYIKVLCGGVTFIILYIAQGLLLS